METQSKSNSQPGPEEAKSNDSQSKTTGVQSTNLEAKDVPIVPFSENDPFRATRIAETNRQTAELCQSLSGEAVGFENADGNTVKALYQDAEERAGWSQARKDGFYGLLRLGVKTPRRRS